MPESRKHVLILGGGVIGVACAHYLLEEGLEVTVVDQKNHCRGLLSWELWIRLPKSCAATDGTGRPKSRPAIPFSPQLSFLRQANSRS